MALHGEARRPVRVPSPEHMDDEQFVNHYNKRHTSELGIKLQPRKGDTSVKVLRAWHARCHDKAPHVDHVHLGTEGVWL